MVFNWLLNKFSKDLAIDLGTANTLIYVKGKGVVVNEPSVVVVNEKSGEVISVGYEAKPMYGRTPKGINAIRPLKDGVIADFEVTKIMIKALIAKASDSRSFIRPRMVICVPSGITSVEKKAVIDSAEQSGAREVFLIEEPMAAAIGANLPIDKPVGNMVVDIGGGTTEVAVISMAGIVQSKSVKVAGDEIDESIVQYLRKNYGLVIGLNAAEQIKFNIGCAYPKSPDRSIEVRGIDIVRGVPRTIIVTEAQIWEGIRDSIIAIVDAIRDTVEQTPPDLVADVVERGIILTGGGALLNGLDTLVNKEVQVPASVCENPLLSVVLGTGRLLDDAELMQRVVIN
jgi:rod shape-determining protein MreB